MSCPTKSSPTKEIASSAIRQLEPAQRGGLHEANFGAKVDGADRQTDVYTSHYMYI